VLLYNLGNTNVRPFQKYTYIFFPRITHLKISYDEGIFKVEFYLVDMILLYPFSVKGSQEAM